MAGLLDALNTYEGQQGLGLLAAAGPRFDGAGFFQRLQEGMGSADKWKREQARYMLEQMQMEEYKNKVEQAKADRLQKASDAELIRKSFAPVSPLGALEGGGGPTIANAQKIGTMPKFDPRQFLAQNGSIEGLGTAVEVNKLLNPAMKTETVAPGATLLGVNPDGTTKTIFSAPTAPKVDAEIERLKTIFGEGTPAYQQALKDYGRKMTTHQPSTVVNTGDNLGLKPKDRFDMEDKLRNDYISSTKTDSEIIANAQDLKNILDQGGALKDQAAIYKFAKSLDPLGAVREADYAAIVRTAGGLDYVTSLFNKALTGEQLSPKQRTEMGNLMSSMAGVAQKRLSAQQGRFTKNAQMYNLKPENIFSPTGNDGWGIVK